MDSPISLDMTWKAYDSKSMGSRVYGRVRELVGRSHRGGAGNSLRGRYTASGRGPGAWLPPQHQGVHLAAPTSAGAADTASWRPIPGAVCLRSAPRRDPADRWIEVRR